MNRSASRRPAVLRAVVPLVLLLAGCRNLEIDPPPQRGGLTAVLDLQGHLALEGQAVDALDAAGSRLTQRTDATGRFAFSDLLPGVYTVSLKLPGFAALVVPSVRVTSGAPIDLGTLTPDWLAGTPAEATLLGKVGVMGGSGDVTGAVVEFLLAGQKIAATSVTSDGNFVQRLPPGTYTLRASHPWYQVGTLADVVLGEGETKDLTATPVLMALNPATLVGALLIEREGLAPVPAANVTVNFGTGTQPSDAQGRFSIGGLAPGPREVRFGLDRYHDVVPFRSVVLEPGKTADLGTITLRLVRGTIVGSVKMADNSSAAGVAIEVSGRTYSTTAASDLTDPSLGRFELRDIPSGSYDVVARREKFSPATANVTVVDDTPVDTGLLTLTLLQGDFDIDDGDSLNLGGFTRTQPVTLDFNKFPSTGVASYRASEDSTFGADTQAFAPYTGSTQPFVLSAVDGLKTVYAQYKDGAGAISRVFSSSIKLDTVAPTLSQVLFDATSPTGTTPRFTRFSQNLSLQISGSDVGSTLARMRVGETVNGAGTVQGVPDAYRSPTTLVRSSLLDGPQPVWVQLIDGAGNVSPARSDTIIVDTQEPSGSITIPRGALAEVDGFTNQVITTINVTTSAEPDGGTVFIKLANANGSDLNAALLQPSRSQLSWFLDPVDGAKTVYALFQDAAGNVAVTEASASITLDRVAPNPASATLTSPSITNSRDAGLTLTTNAADLAPRPLTVSENPYFQGADAGAFPALSTLQYLLSDSDGDKTLYVRFRDRAGNDAFSSVGVRLDRVAPTLSLSVLGTLADGARSAELTAQATVDVTLLTNETAWYVLGNETLTCPQASSATWLPLSQSTLTAQSLTGALSPRQVKACVRDAAGNVTGPVSASIALDASTPTGCGLTLSGSRADTTAAPPAGFTAKPNVRVALTGCSEVPYEIALTQDVSISCSSASSLSWQRYSATSSLNYLLSGGEGSNTVRGCVRDQARNTGSIAASSITLDTVPPQSPYLSIDTGAAYINDATALVRGGNIGSVVGLVSGATEWSLSEDATGAGFTTWDPYAATPRDFRFAGTGVRNLYAVFRDAVGNWSAVAFDAIDIDRTPPDVSAATVSLSSTAPNVDFTNSVSVTAELRGTSADTWQVKLAEASTTACSAATVSGVNAVPATRFYTFLLSSGDGLKRLCVQYLDLAGNASTTLVTDTITLDTTPPTTMRIVTQPSVVSLDAGTGFPVEVAALSTDTSTVTYEQLGGTLTSWTTTSTTATTPKILFSFTLANTGAQLGTANDLQLRARDEAGNVSGVSSVLVTADTVPPAQVQTDPSWVDNTNGASTLYWQSSTQADVAYDLVAYGSSAVDLTGSFASQGISPVRTPPVTNFTLSNLPNGSPVYVSVTPVDAAGNKGTPSTSLLLQANEVSPNIITTLSLGNFAAGRLASLGTALYVAGTEMTAAEGGTCTGNSALQVVDMRSMTAPVQNGGIVTSPAVPRKVGAVKVFVDQVTCTANAQNVDVLVDGIHLFLVAGKRVHIFDLSDPLSPVELTAVGGVDLSSLGATFNASSASVQGDRLFINSLTPNTMAVLSLARLYDDVAATRPTSADLMASASAGGTASAMVLSRNRAMAFGSSGGGGSTHYNVGGVLDGGLPDAGTAVTGSIAVVGTGNAINVSSRPVVSGNYLYGVGGSFGFSVFDLTTSWSATGSPVNFPAVGVSTTYGSGQFEVHGTEAFAVDLNKYLHGIDLTDATLHRETSGYTLDPAFDGHGFGSHVLTHGNYLAVAAGSMVTFLETATPRAMRLRSSLVGTGYRPALQGGFVVTSGQYTAYDVQSGTQPVLVSQTGTSLTCSSGFAMLDDTEVLAVGPRVMLINHEAEFDRNATTFHAPLDVAMMSLAGRVTDADAVGNRLVVTQVRTTAPAGVYLEVFDARKQRDRNVLTSLAATDTRGAFLLAGSSSSVLAVPETTMWGSYAVVTIDGVSSATNVFVVDLRALLDDDATTTTPVLTSSFTINDGLSYPRPRTTSIFYPYAAIATSAGVYVYDLSGSLDTNASTTQKLTPEKVFASGFQFDSTAVFGSYLFAVPSSATSGILPTGMPVYDLSAPSPTNWVQTTSMPIILKAGSQCVIIGDTARLPKNGIVVKGSRAWMNIENTLREISLE